MDRVRECETTVDAVVVCAERLLVLFMKTAEMTHPRIARPFTTPSRCLVICQVTLCICTRGTTDVEQSHAKAAQKLLRSRREEMLRKDAILHDPYADTFLTLVSSMTLCLQLSVSMPRKRWHFWKRWIGVLPRRGSKMPSSHGLSMMFCSTRRRSRFPGTEIIIR